MKKDFSLEEKLAAIKLVEQGQSARSVSRDLHLNRNNLYEWLAAYKDMGIRGLKPKRKKKKRVPYEERCKIIREYQESELTLCQLSAKYNISNSVISTWVKLAERDGFEALESHKSRHSKIGGHMVKRLSKDEFEKENERLRKENERLRLENLLLKKVRALVEEREARNRAIGRKPSKN